MNTKASNAVVAVVDFYAGELAAVRAEVEQKDAVIRQLGEQLKRARLPEARDRTAMDIARDGVVGAALLLVDGAGKSGWRAKLDALKGAVGGLRARAERAGEIIPTGLMSPVDGGK